MSIINLSNVVSVQKNFEEIKLSPQKSFKIKSNYTTDPLNLFDEKITDSNSVILPNYPLTGQTSYGLVPLYSYKTNKLKEVGNGGNTQIAVQDFKKNALNNTTNVFNNLNENSNFNNLSNIRPLTVTNNAEVDSNYFGIKRLKQELKPFSSSFNKKQITKKLYQNNRCLSDAKFSQKYYHGFYNYNCFNFFNILPATKVSSQYKNNFKNNSHKNALIYSNQSLNGSQIQLGNKDDMTINFWINPKRTAVIGKRYNPGCILHLPNIISIYLIADNTKLNANNQEIEFKILCHLGEHANKLVENNTIPDHGKLLSNDNLILNTWHNISIIINNNDVKLFVDDNLTNTTEDINDLNIGTHIPSILTIGNRLNNETVNFWTTNKQQLKNTFFNNTTFTEQHLNPAEITIPNNNTASVAWNTLISNKTAEDFNYALHSHALNAELYGLMIFNNEIEYSKLKLYAYGYEEVINNIYLSFYVPCVYIADLIKRKGYITLGTRDDIAYRSCVNPYFAHKIYGHELSIESFILDVINLRRPYILGMNGDEYPNSMSTNSGNFSNNDSFVLNDKINLVKDYFAFHKTPTELLNKVVTSNLVLFDKNFSDKNFQFNNIVYRNNFILPCDNGQTRFNLNSIFNAPQIKTILGDSLNIFYHEKNPHFVKLDTLYTSDVEYSFQSPVNFFANESIYFNLFQNPFININTLISPPTNQTFVSESLIDKNNSNYLDYLFYNKILNKDTKPLIQDFFNKLKALHNSSSSKHLFINSIFKNIDSSYDASVNIPENIVWTNKALIDELGNEIQGSKALYSKYYNSHYSIEGDLGETHSVLFDISNVLYSSQLRPKFIEIIDVDLAGSGGALNMKIKDNGQGIMYRADCNGKHATWAHLGHVFYSDGLLNVLHPGLSNFGENNFSFNLKGEHSLYVMQSDIPVERGEFNSSQNPTYINGLKPSNNLSDLEETNFVYITGVNLHDENLNIVAKAKFAQPIVKRLNDRYNIRLKMDF